MKSRRLPAIALIIFLLSLCPLATPAKAIDTNSIALAWDPSPDLGVVGYNVYRTETAGTFSSPPINGVTLVTSTSFTDSTAQGNRTYYYAVTAVDETGVESSRSNAVQVIVVPTNQPPPVNRAPVVGAGANRNITLPSSVSLTATATDDGLPGGPLTYRWTVVEGSGVNLLSPQSSTTQVSFTAAGVYTLRVTVDDGQLSSSDIVVVTVQAGQASQNRAPTVSAGADQTTSLTSASLAATATDDGLPGGTLTYRWSVVQGSGVTFQSPQSAATRASFAASGVYTLRVTASDGQLTSSDDVVVTAGPGPNRVPTASAGADQTITLQSATQLSATATDDGLPNARLTYQWSVLEGSGVSFQSPRSATTKASFSASGKYTLLVVVSDGQLTASDDVVVTVQPKPRGNTNRILRAMSGQTVTASTTVNDQTSARTNQTLAVSNSQLSTSDDVLSNVEAKAIVDFLRVRPQDASAPSLGMALVVYEPNGKRNSDSVVQSAPAVRNGRFYVVMQDSLRTAIAVANPNSESVIVDFRFADETGSLLHTGQLSLPPGGSASAFLDELPFRPDSSIDLSRIRTFTFSASAAVAITALRTLRNERWDSLMAALPIADLDQPNAPVTLPFYAEGGDWHSEIQLVNPTTETLRGTLQFFPSLKASGPDFVYEIPPSSAVAFPTGGLGSEVRMGWVQTVPAAGHANPVGSLIVSNKTTNGMTTSMGTIFSTRAASSYHVYAEMSGNNAGQPGSFYTTLAVANPASTPASVTFELLDENWRSTNFRGSLTIGAHDKVLLDLNQIPGMEGLANPIQGIVKIAGDPITAAGFLVRYIDDGQFNITPLPAIDTSLPSGPRFLFKPEGDGFSTHLKDVDSMGSISQPSN